MTPGSPEAGSPQDGDSGRERERVAAALRESEARYRMALIAGRMGSWETDLVTRTRTWSKEGMDLFGLDLPEGRGQVGGEIDEYERALHPEDRHLVRRFHALADEQDSFLAEYRIVRPDGAVLWLSGRGLVVARDRDGRAERLVSIMADVSERRQADEVLRIERERLALALQVGQMGVYDFNVVDDVLWWSPQTYVVFGVAPESFVPTRASVLALLHPDDRDAFLQRRTEAIAERRGFQLEFRIVRGDGSLAWISHRGQTEYDGEGRPLRHFGIALDITERKHAEQALRDADRKKDTFIATLAHELRNPLAPIRNAVGRLRQGGPIDAQQIAWCRDVIDRQVAQMARLLEDLLDVSRMTRGQFALRRERVSLRAVIEQAIEIAQPLVDAAGHTLEVAGPAQPIDIEGDLTRLAQVFSNLLINAAKYTEPRGRIALAVTRQGDEAVVSVSDNGIGISAEQMPRIFEMFGQARTAADGAQGGLGIGLSLARGFVEMHGGRISARSDGIGQGSVFVVRLPVAQSASSAESAAPAGVAIAAASGRRRVLIADDLRDSADTLALLLEAMGHEVHVAYDGAEALQAIETLRPEVALLDLGMPKLSGYEVCRRIRGLPWGGRLTLIAQSGWGQDDDRRRTHEAGFDQHLVKPIDPVALDAMLRSLAVGE